MAENTHLIEKLNDGQRAELAADITVLSNDEYTEAGMPKVRFLEADRASDGIYPSYKAMANSWSKELVREVWQDVSSSRREDAEVIVSPAAGTGVTPYSACAAEDPCLAGALASSFVSGVKNAGLTPCISCAMSDVDYDYMDGASRGKVLPELYFTAYDGIPKGAAYIMPDQVVCNYTDTLKTYLRRNDKDGAIIYSGEYGNDVEDCLRSGVILSGGSAQQLQETFKEGDGVSPEGKKLIDGAARRAADFAALVNQKGEAEPADEEKRGRIALKIAEQSCVLLKNDGVLPVKAGARLAVMGALSKDVNAQALCDMFKTTNRYMYVRRKGYDANGGIDPRAADEAVQTARGVNYAVVFLGFTQRAGERSRAQKRVKLPAVQLGLLDRLAAIGTKIIAVVGADYPADLSFDDKVAAILVCPSTGGSTAQALFNIITGKTSPSGRLAQTWYRDADEKFRMLKNEISTGTRKTGALTGYRGYVTGGEAQPYPFGFGLSYTKFAYSSLSIKKNVIKFKVKNVGQYAAGEVIQVYVGKSDSAIVRPKMQLKAFIRVFLKSGETTVCKVKCSPKTFETFNGGVAVERGNYDVYIGSSSRDIKLTGKIYVRGDKFKKDGESAYLYDTSKTNIPDGGFTLEKVKKIKLFGVKPFRVGVLLALAVVLALLVLAALQTSGYIDFSYMDEWAVFGIGCVITAASAAVLLMLTGGIALMITQNTKKLASSGESSLTAKGDPKPLDKLFAELYGPDEYDEYDDGYDYDGYSEPLPKEEKKPAQEVTEEPAADASQPEAVTEEAPPAAEPAFTGKYDKDVTYDDLCAWLSAFTESKGISIGRGGARKAFAALASSRLVIVGGATRSAGGLADALSEYFAGEAYNCDLAACGEEGVLKSEAFASALKHAQDNPDDMVLLTLNGADDGTAGHILPFIRCGYAKETVRVRDGGGYADIPANMWLLIVPATEMFSFSDKLLCRVSAVLLTEVNRCEARYAGEYTKLNYEQFARMNDRLLTLNDDDRYVLDEEHCWKRIDAVEKYLNGASGYVLDNRDCLSMERYAAVYLACGGDQNDALDNVAAVKMVLPAMQALKAANVKEDDFAALIESKFVDYSDIKKVINYLR